MTSLPKLGRSLCVLLATLSLQSAFAADGSAPTQLDTTPPAPEGALASDQTPPILSPQDSAGSNLSGTNTTADTAGSIGVAKPSH